MTLSAIILRLEGVFALTGDVYHAAMNEAFSEAGFAHRISRAAFAETFGHDVGRDVFLAYASRHLYPRKQTSDLRTLFEVTFKHLRQIGLDLPHVGAVFGHGFTSLGGGQFGRGAVFIRRTDEHHFMPPCAGMAGIKVCMPLAAHQFAHVLDAVNVSDR